MSPRSSDRGGENCNFDFGKFDYAVVDGKAVLYDANRTPGIGRFPEERYLPIVQNLGKRREGISMKVAVGFW